MGVPVLGCCCSVCQSGMERLRPSVLVEENGKKLLIDMTPDFRRQALCYPVLPLDAIFLTHAHFDHIAGIPELRPLFWQKEQLLPIYAHPETRRYCEETYFYTLEGAPVDWISLDADGGRMEKGPIPFEYLVYRQGNHPVIGLRFGDAAYVTDIHTYEKESLFSFLKGVKKLMISCQIEKIKNHLSLEEVRSIAEEAEIKQLYLIHLDHHFSLDLSFPAHTCMAFDGMVIPYVRN